jgi:hypothetical protein
MTVVLNAQAAFQTNRDNGRELETRQGFGFRSALSVNQTAGRRSHRKPWEPAYPKGRPKGGGPAGRADAAL